MAQINSITTRPLLLIDDGDCTVTPLAPGFIVVEIDGEVGCIWVQIPNDWNVPIGEYCQRAYDIYAFRKRQGELGDG